MKLDIPVDMPLLPSINRWWIVGPFDAPDADRLQQAFGPEEKLDLQATYVGKDGKSIGWKKVERVLTPASDLTDELFVEFRDVYDAHLLHAVAYGLVYLRAPRAMDVTLALGSDDGVVVWLNDVEVFRNDVGRPYTSKEDRVPVHLNAGANKLMLKIAQGGGMWGFGAHIENAAGEVLPEITAHFAP